MTVCTVVKSKVEILQNFVAFSEYMNFNFLIFSLTIETDTKMKWTRSWAIWKTWSNWPKITGWNPGFFQKFVRFLEESKTSKFALEIYWPLAKPQYCQTDKYKTKRIISFSLVSKNQWLSTKYQFYCHFFSNRDQARLFSSLFEKK